MALSGIFGDLIGVQAVFIAAGVMTIVAGVAASYTLQGAERAAKRGMKQSKNLTPLFIWVRLK
ncbi:unnamed protein product [marine sediment metagenome]|uniref:Uncharacterized protein n=1 Tax=marine sediment metagenome TaxID=412755 RepID=X0RRC8_9ZZZZ